jgi:hypothetical protein
VKLRRLNMSLPIKGGFAGVKESSFDALEGTFSAKLVKASWKEAKEETVQRWQSEKGHPGETHGGVITWEFDITEPGYENRKVWHRTSLTPEGKPMTLAVLLAFGHTRDEVDAEDFTYDPEADYGKEVSLKCKPDRNDDTQTRVNAITALQESSSLLP